MTTLATHPFVSRLLQRPWPPAAALLLSGLIGFLLPAGYGLLNGVREPAVHDEFSYLLAADTFAQGRLSNPAPALPEFFEAPHVLVTPTYNSKYPPGQALMLALGTRTFGHPIWGVWLTCGLFAASLCWMLQAWSSRRWAIAITLLTTVTLGTSSYWAQSYWGGMLAATGGALLLGSLRQTIHRARVHVSVLMALGILILANTRPYEGFLLCFPAGLLVAHWLLRSAQAPLSTKIRLVVIPVCAVLVAGVLCMGTYNRAVTGSFTQTAYEVHVRQYWQRGIFVFDRVHQPERTPPERVATFYRQHETQPQSGVALLSTVQQNLSSRLFGLAGTPFGVAYLSPDPGYQGLLLSLALLISVWRSRSLMSTLLIVLIAVAAECLAWKYVPFYPRLLIFLVVTCWVAAFYLMFRRERRLARHGTRIIRDADRRGTSDAGRDAERRGSASWHQSARFMLGALAVLAIGQSLTLWWWPHYAAPALPLLLAIVAITAESLAQRSPLGVARRLGAVTAVVAVVHVSTLGLVAHAYGNSDDGAGGGRGRRRAEVRERLERKPEKHLVFVHYADGYTVHDEWVYNPADLQAAQVLFAHDLGKRNPELVSAYPGRTTWLLTIATKEIHLEFYRAQ